MSKTRWMAAGLSAAVLAFTACGQSESSRRARTEEEKQPGILEQDKGVYESGNPAMNGTGGSGSTSGAAGNPSSEVGTGRSGSQGLINEDAQSPGMGNEQAPSNGNHTKVNQPHSSTY